MLKIVWTQLFATSSLCVICLSTFSDAAIGETRKHTSTDYEVPIGWTESPWISETFKLGQVSGVSVDKNNSVYIFHRGTRIWDSKSFNLSNVFTEQNDGPIQEATILVFHENGTLLRKSGVGMFYLPHGLTVDHDFNIWVTDVALHQVMKFSPRSDNPELVLGVRFKPGQDSQHFCKPTSVAVASDGHFFVADGYCNSRILKFDSNGVKVLEWGRSTVHRTHGLGHNEFYIPHALTLAEDKGEVCVADRENGRVLCYNATTGSFIQELEGLKSLVGNRIFSVTYSSSKGGLFFVVNAEPWRRNLEVHGYVLDSNGKYISQFGRNLKTAHDVAVSSDASHIYVGELKANEGKTAWKYTIIPDQNLSLCSHPPQDAAVAKVVQTEENSSKGLTGTIFITSACLIFSAVILYSAFIYTRSRISISKDSISLLQNSEM